MKPFASSFVLSVHITLITSSECFVNRVEFKLPSPQPLRCRLYKHLPRGATTLAASVTQENSKTPWLAQPGTEITRSRDKFVAEAENAYAMVTPEIRDTYARDGVVVVKNVISADWVALLQAACVTAQEKAGPFAERLHQPSDAGIYFTDLELARRLPDFAAFSLYGPCAAIAAAVMSSHSARFLYDQLFIKEAGVTTPTFWHQDQGYWKVYGKQVSSVFVPLDYVVPEDGLAFILGSHGWPLHNPQNFADGSPYSETGLPPMPDISAGLKKGGFEALRFELQPGDALVFSGSIVHGGSGNWGRALSTRWIGEDVRYHARPNVMVPTGQVGLSEGEPFDRNSHAFPLVWPPERRST